jgi:hypothetical protein
MERYCGSLVRAVKSRVKPYIALGRRILHQSQIDQIKLQYGLEDILDLSDSISDVSSQEHMYPECRLPCLRPMGHPC